MPGHVGGENYIFVTESELERQQARVEAGEEPWKTAHDSLLQSADRALERDLRAVTDVGESHAFDMGDGEDYRDYRAAVAMSEAARDCGLAYWFTGADRYAERVVEVLQHWTLHPETYMRPTVNETGYPLTIEQHITIPAFCYGASFVRGHPAWDDYASTMPWRNGAQADSAEAAFATWVDTRHRTFVVNRPGGDFAHRCSFNNVWAWRIVDRAATAAYLGHDDAMETATGSWRATDQTTCADGSELLRPWNDFTNSDDRHAYDGDGDPAANGYFTKELSREQGFHYSAYNLKALSTALTVFRRYDGSDLWAFNAPTDRYDGSSLWKAFNWLEEYVRNTGAWRWNAPWKPISADSVEDATASFELAYARWGEFYDVLVDPDVIDGRPHWDANLLGPVTLTHGAPEPHDGYTVTEPTVTPDTPTPIPRVEGLAVTRNEQPKGSGPQPIDVEGVIRRDGETTVYEVRLPWDAAPIDAETDVLGLSLLVNDSDGEGRIGWVEWGSGIGSSKDPSQFERATIGPGEADVYGIRRSDRAVDGRIDAESMPGEPIDLDASGTPVSDGADVTVGGQVWFTYDDTGVVFAALIEDETHHQEGSVYDLWRGDSIQVGITSGPPSEAASFQEFAIGGNPTE